MSEQLKQTILNSISTIMIKFLLALITNALVGGLVSAAMGVSPAIGAIGFNVMAAVAPALPGGSLLAGLYAELWTGETVKAFRNSAANIGWLERIRSYDQAVASNNTIIGGISTAAQVIEMMLAGASAVEIGTANLRNPYVCKQVLQDLPGLMDQYGIHSLKEIIGGAHV